MQTAVDGALQDAEHAGAWGVDFLEALCERWDYVRRIVSHVHNRVMRELAHVYSALGEFRSQRRNWSGI